MKSIYLYIVGLLVVSAVAMPFVVKKQINTKIESDKQSLLLHGVEFNVLKEEGYVSSIREYELKIVDGRKFRDYVLAQLLKQNSQYKELIKLMQKNSERDIRPALDGTTFNGIIKTSNFLMESPYIELSLVRLSDELMNTISNDKELVNAVQPMLDEKMITFFITLDKNQNLSKIVMKNIDKDINDKSDIINFKLKDHNLQLNVAEDIKGIYKIGTQSVTAKDFFMEMKDLEYSFDYFTQFENKASLQIKSFEAKEKRSLFKIGNIGVKSAIKEVDNSSLNADISYSIKDLYFQKYNIIQVDSFTLNLDIYDLNRDSIIAASDAYNNITFKNTRVNKDDIKVLTNALQLVLNKGFKTDIKSSLNGLIFKKLTFDKIDLILNAKLKPNTSTLKGFSMINSLLVSGSISLNKKSLDEMVKLDRSIKKVTELGKKEGDKIVFNYEFKEGSFFVNGTKI